MLKYESITVPVSKWEWDVFGQGLVVVFVTVDPPWWRRVITSIFLGSTWKRL